MREDRFATIAPVLPDVAQQASMQPSRGRRTTKWSARQVIRACPGLIKMVADRPAAYCQAVSPPLDGQTGRDPGATWVVTPSVEGQLEIISSRHALEVFARGQ